MALRAAFFVLILEVMDTKMIKLEDTHLKKIDVPSTMKLLSFDEIRTSLFFGGLYVDR